MLAPWCEGARAPEPVITRLGIRSARSLARANFLACTSFNGSLVVSHPRDCAPIFASVLRSRRRAIGASTPSAVTEPRALARGPFSRCAVLSRRGPCRAARGCCRELHAAYRGAAGGTVHFDSERQRPDGLDGIVIDCRKWPCFARDARSSNLRGVKGEMIMVETDEIALVAPGAAGSIRAGRFTSSRGANNQFMIGATTIEREDYGVSVRSALELLELPPMRCIRRSARRVLSRSRSSSAATAFS